MWARVLWRLKEVQDQAEKVRVGKIVEDEEAFAVYCPGTCYVTEGMNFNLSS